MNSSMFDALEWKQGLEQDDPERMATFLQEANKQTALVLALAHTPRPTQVLESLLSQGAAIAEQGYADGGWLMSARRLKESADIDWDDAFSWLEQHMDRATLRTHAEAAWNHLLPRHQQERMSGPLLIGIVTHYPELLDITLQAGHKKELFFLSILHPQSIWPERLGVDLAEWLHDTNKIWGMEEWMRPAELGAPSLFDAWRSVHPGREEAYQQVLENERALMDQEMAWRATWIANDDWENSAIKAWAEDILRLGYSNREDPHPEALFGNADQDEMTANEKAAMYLRQHSAKGMDMYSQRLLHNCFRAQRNANALQPGNAPLLPLAQGLNEDQPWADEAMERGYYQDQARAILEDPRAVYLLQNWKGSDVVQWILEQPVWQTWRNSRDQGLLDVWIQSQQTLSKYVKIPGNKLLTLARRCPEVLNHTNVQGERVLNQMDCSDDIRSQATRIMLDKVRVDEGVRDNPARKGPRF